MFISKLEEVMVSVVEGAGKDGVYAPKAPTTLAHEHKLLRVADEAKECTS